MKLQVNNNNKKKTKPISVLQKILRNTTSQLVEASRMYAFPALIFSKCVFVVCCIFDTQRNNPGLVCIYGVQCDSSNMQTICYDHVKVIGMAIASNICHLTSYWLVNDLNLKLFFLQELII